MQVFSIHTKNPGWLDLTLQPKTTIAAQPSVEKICKKVEKKNSRTQTTGQRPVEFFIKNLLGK